jgi:hypothetical protein
MPSSTIEVAIGIAFLFLLFSLIASTLTEWFARALAMRSTTLATGIRTLLQDPTGRGFSKLLYDHPLIKGLSTTGDQPSYIPAETFAIALLDLLRIGARGGSEAKPIAQITEEVAQLPDSSAKTAATNLVNALAVLMAPAGAGTVGPPGSASGPATAIASEELLRAIAALVGASAGDPAALRKNLEDWFNAAMERVSGWYKRNVQIVTLVIGLVLVVALNADTLMIANGFFRDPVLRASVVAAAGQAAKEPITNLDLPKIQQEFRQLKLPIGWSGDPADGRGLPTSPSEAVAKVVGLLLTAVAISLGAAFWFDALNKLVNLRATGDPPPVSQPQAAAASARKDNPS